MLDFELFRRAVERSPDLMSLANSEGSLVYANPAHVPVLGFTPEELVGMPGLDLVHPDDRAAAAMAIVDTFEGTGLKGAIPVRLRRKDGSWIEVSTDATAVDDSNGAPHVLFVSRPAGSHSGPESELARLSAMLRAQQETTQDGVLVLTPTGDLISYNQNFLTIWGMTREEAESGHAGRSRHIATQLSDPDAAMAVIDHVHGRPGESFAREVQLANGRVIEVHSAPFASDDGEVHGRVWFFRDVSERHRAESELKESEARYRRLVDLSPNAIGVHIGGVIKYANAAALQLLGLSLEQALGRNVFEFVHPEDQETVVNAALEREFASPRFVEARLVLPGGQIRHVEMGSSGTTLDGERATQTVMRDITQRLQAEQAMRESEERYRALVENAPDAIFAHDGRRIRYANHAAADMLGFSRPAEVIGLDPWEVIRGIDRAVFDERVSKVMSGETHRFAERRFLTYAGREADVELALAPATFSGVPLVQVMMRDVTERRRAEDQRLALERKLLETQKLESLGVLAGGIAHDFNNLLVAIMGNAGLAMLESEPDSPVAAYLHEIETASQRAADLARQMLAYSGKGRFVVEAADLSGIVREIANLLTVSMPKKASIQFRLAQGLPSVEADATQLRQIIMNLVINAAEALGDAAGAITLETGTMTLSQEALAEAHGGDAAPGPFVYLRVTDTGMGMDSATLNRIFEPFFTTKFTGRGLGLAAVLGIVRGHYGAIRVESAPGAGTSFELFLPAVAQPSTEAPDVELPARTSARFRGWALVVDDEAPVRKVAAGMLAKMGFEVLEASDGDEAWERFSPSLDKLSLLLADMTMPGMDGCELVGAVRGAGSNVPALIMSGYSDTAAECATRDGVQFVQKPFTMSELERAITAVASPGTPGQSR